MRGFLTGSSRRRARILRKVHATTTTIISGKPKCAHARFDSEQLELKGRDRDQEWKSDFLPKSDSEAVAEVSASGPSSLSDKEPLLSADPILAREAWSLYIRSTLHPGGLLDQRALKVEKALHLSSAGSAWFTRYPRNCILDC